MSVRIEKQGKVWTVIHSRPEAKNAMLPSARIARGSHRLTRPAGVDGAVAEALLERVRSLPCIAVTMVAQHLAAG